MRSPENPISLSTSIFLHSHTHTMALSHANCLSVVLFCSCTYRMCVSRHPQFRSLRIVGSGQMCQSTAGTCLTLSSLWICEQSVLFEFAIVCLLRVSFSEPLLQPFREPVQTWRACVRERETERNRYTYTNTRTNIQRYQICVCMWYIAQPSV